ncbi:hypothetical protein A0O28_0011850 [Trichoderma guizhouense]|uniref:Uncharacterized protein n=1 Tax=Trichoderma guizhouense TaxID=1491466 RepID=A0A1T3CAR2_9HYPO|nr:hypothetical protein A0O28_0011850 [Trichoderma guizhouense]
MANPLEQLISQLEDEIQDPEEETFLLYANDIPSQGLGFIDSHASVLDLQLAGRDLTIHQSPGVLASSRKGGTTGAVLWKITPAFAEWLASPSNPLFRTVLTPSCSIIELGCGISPLNALTLSPKVSRYILTDQPYVQKLVLQNLAENQPSKSHAGKSKRGANKSSSSSPLNAVADIHFQVLDWETSQQLRNDDVFNSWLVAFKEQFRVWRMPGGMMPAELRPEAGFVVHIGILKDSL